MKRLYDLQSGATLSRQMLTIFSLGLILFTAFQILTIDYNIKDAAIQKTGEEDVKQAAFFASLIDSDVAETLSSINAQASSMHGLGMTSNFKMAERLLNGLQEAQLKYAWIGYADDHGILKAATQGMLVGRDVSARPWFIQGKEHLAAIDVHDALLLAKMLQEKDDHSPLRFIDVASPVHNQNGKMLGVLAAHLSISWLDERVSFYTSATNSDSEFKPFVTGHDGMFRFGNRVAFEGLENFKNLWRNEKSSGHTILNHKKYGPMVVSYSKHKSTNLPNEMGWVTVIATPVNKVIAESWTHRVITAGSVLGLALLIWGFMVWLLQKVSQPVDQLIDAIEDAKHNGYEIRELDGLPKEFSLVRTQVNQLLNTLQDREKNLKAALDQINTSFTGVTENFPGVLFSLEDCRGGCFDFTYLSDSVHEYFVLAEQVPKMAKEFFAKVLVDTSPENVERIRTQLLQPNQIDFVVQTHGKSGDVRQMRFKAHSRHLASGALAWDGIAIDITDLIATQLSAAAADEAKSRFLATMSHEIRTPLNGILGLTQVLQQDTEDLNAKQDLQRIMDTTETLSRILNDILDFAKIEDGKLELETRSFTLNELITSTLPLFSGEAKQRGLNLSTHISGNADLALSGDPVRIRQIITKHSLLVHHSSFVFVWYASSLAVVRADCYCRARVVVHCSDPEA